MQVWQKHTLLRIQDEGDPNNEKRYLCQKYFDFAGCEVSAACMFKKHYLMKFIFALLIMVLVSGDKKSYLIDLNEPIWTWFSAPIFDHKEQIISLIDTIESSSNWIFNAIVYLTWGFYYLKNPDLFEEHAAYAILLGIDHQRLVKLNFIVDMITNTTLSIVKTPMEIILTHSLDLVELE